jgi:DNA-binding CsgD family transcriptional regulator
VNYHLKHVYQKLEVNGRRRAVDRAMERGLLRA